MYSSTCVRNACGQELHKSTCTSVHVHVLVVYVSACTCTCKKEMHVDKSYTTRKVLGDGMFNEIMCMVLLEAITYMYFNLHPHLL